MSDLITPVMSNNDNMISSKINTPSPYMVGGVNTLENTPYMDTFEPEAESHTVRNVGLGILGVAALAALADGIITKGKNLKKVGQWFKNLGNKASKEVKGEHKKKSLDEKLKKLKEADSASGETIKDGIICDSNGNKLRKVTEGENGLCKIEEFENGQVSKIYEFQPEQMTLTELNKDGKNIKSIVTDSEEKILSETNWEYHPSGKPSKCVVDSDKSNQLQQWDEKGRLIHETILNKEADSKIVTDYNYSRFSSVKTVQEFDGNGNLVKETKEYTGLKKFFNLLKFWEKQSK